MLGHTSDGLPNNHIDDNNKLNLFFANLDFNTVKNLPHSEQFKKYLANSYSKSFFMSPTTPEEISTIVAGLKNKSSAGFDKISTSLLNKIIASIACPISDIINNSFLSGIVPDRIKIARVIPINKSGDKADLANYSPISILPSISQIFEKAVSKCVVKFLEHNLILTKSQHGFHSSHNVNTAITIIIDYMSLVC